MAAKLIKPLIILVIIAVMGGVFYMRVFGTKPIKIDEASVSGVFAVKINEEEILEYLRKEALRQVDFNELKIKGKPVDTGRFVSGVNEVITYKKDGDYESYFATEIERRDRQIQELIDLGSRKTAAKRETLEKLQNSTESAVVFLIEMSDGQTMDITVAKPFVIVNGTGYRGKISVLEELSKLGE